LLGLRQKHYARITNHFFAQVSATFQHAKDNTKGLLHNPTDTYYNAQFSAVEIQLGCIPANVVSYTTALFGSKAPSAISLYRVPGR